MRDLLGMRLAALDTARQPFRSATWMAALSVIAGRGGGDFARTRGLGAARFRAGGAARDHPPRGRKPCLRIVRGLFAAPITPGDRAPGRRAGAGAAAAGWTGSTPRTASPTPGSG